MIDLHSHVLPGVDDGPATLEDSLRLAHAAAAQGTTVLVATPHVSYHYPTDSEAMLALVDEVNRALRDDGIPLEVARGAEVAHDMLLPLPEPDLRQLTLGGGGYVLLEAPLAAVGGELEDAVAELQRRGYGVVLAHPERSPSMHRDPDRLARMVAAGVLTSITAASLTGGFGRTVRSFSERLLTHGQVHNVASDAHDHERRPPIVAAHLAAAAEELSGLGDQTAWLTEQAPRAILSGQRPPAPPAAVGRRRRRRLSWRR